MNECTFVILGFSGDLAKRKLIPALYHLVKHKKITQFLLVGAAFDDTDVATIFANAKPFILNCDEAIFASMQAKAVYQRLNFMEQKDFDALAVRVNELEKQHGLPGKRIIYCAAASQFFCPITQHVAVAQLAEKKATTDPIWHRIVYEKPFGHDSQSAQEINACIAENFNESQIYRIDHYLTKELVGNIALVRFTNLVFEPLWNNRYIDNVQIVLSEKVCVEQRGAYYDQYGAVRDMLQNHMLELVALIGMEPPENLKGEYIRRERAKVLEKIKVVDAVLGQYEGYQQEKGVAPDSTTETFAAAYLTVDNHRWAGVPFYLKTGKCLDKKETVIHIKFKQVDCLLTKNCPMDSNYLTIEVAPEASFALTLNAKKPDTEMDVVPVKMEFCHSCIFGEMTPESYEVIFQELVRGEQSIGVRFDEIESAWKVADHVRDLNAPVHTYEKGSSGPKELEDFARKHGIRWRS